jgi:hypothetical protein
MSGKIITIIAAIIAFIKKLFRFFMQQKGKNAPTLKKRTESTGEYAPVGEVFSSASDKNDVRDLTSKSPNQEHTQSLPEKEIHQELGKEAQKIAATIDKSVELLAKEAHKNNQKADDKDKNQDKADKKNPEERAGQQQESKEEQKKDSSTDIKKAEATKKPPARRAPAARRPRAAFAPLPEDMLANAELEKQEMQKFAERVAQKTSQEFVERTNQRNTSQGFSR